jgi:catechol 2,3-dioxygenase-like lactoylglutathione lyase family enzyme
VKLRLHHVNVVSDNLEELHNFYEDVLGLPKMPLPPMIDHIGHDDDLTPDEAGEEEWRENVGFFDAGEGDQLQIHAGRRQAYLGPRMGHSINPLLTGHFAFRTDNLDECRKHLTDKGVPFADYGEWAVKGWDQIFFTDPAGNVIEIHQLLS